MRQSTRTSRRTVSRWVIALLVGATVGCAPTVGQVRTADGPTAGEDGNHLIVEQTPEQQERTLASLRLLDDDPLLLMTHYGKAPYVDESSPSAVAGPQHPNQPGPAARPNRAADYACTVFIAAGDPTRPVVGRNFDWDPHPALVLLADPPDGYASISVVDISYLGYDHEDALALTGTDADPNRRRDLLRAVTLPFDGMNEHGLVVGMAALDNARADVQPERPVVGSVGIMRLLLDRTRTVDEAVALLDRYTIDFTGGPPLHYFVADANGDSAVVEFVDGTTRVLRREQSWQLMVNFQLADATDEQRTADWRYRDGSARLAAADGRLDWAQSMTLLSELRQGHTQWSVAYEPTTGAAHLSTGQRFDRVHHLRVPGR